MIQLNKQNSDYNWR